MVTLKEYFELEYKDDVNFYWKYSNVWNSPEDVFNIGLIDSLRFGAVKDLQYDLEKGIDIFKSIEIYERLGVRNIPDTKIDKYCQAFNYLISEIKRVNEIEEMLLSSNIKSELIDAGIDELNELGVYLQIRQIALTFGITIDKAKELKYSDCLLELVTQKRLSDYEQRVIEIRKRKKDKSIFKY